MHSHFSRHFTSDDDDVDSDKGDALKFHDELNPEIDSKAKNLEFGANAAAMQSTPQAGNTPGAIPLGNNANNIGLIQMTN